MLTHEKKQPKSVQCLFRGICHAMSVPGGWL